MSDVIEFRRLLGGVFEGEPLTNPQEEDVRSYLKGVKRSMADGGPLVLLWSGHGLASPVGGLRMLAANSGDDLDDGLSASDVVAPCALSGANQLLFLVDTCFSGEALAAGDVATQILELLPPEGRHVWVGVLASCLALETARDGLFGKRIRALMQHGPATPELRLRWSPHNEYLRGDDLCDALLKEWDSDRQSPDFRTRGNAWWMFPNPLYEPGAPEQVVEHLLQAARGGARADERSWFTGRTVEVNRVVASVLSNERGVYVVTGSAGTGKSAIVGRVVSLSNPEERQRLLAEGRSWSHDDSGERSVHAHLHARGLTADRAADLIADQLVRRKVLPAQEERRNASELVGQLQRVVEEGARPPVIVVDGLDEARGEAFTIADELLLRLARHAVLVVATRELSGSDEQLSLVGRLAPDGAALDLDGLEVQERARADLHDYVVARLTGEDSLMDPESVAEVLVGTTSMTESRPFLLARLVTDQLRSAPVDTHRRAWQTTVRKSIEEAFDADLAAVDASARSERAVTGTTGSARSLLSALAWAFGAGFPEDEWLAVANALSGPTVEFGRDDATWVLGQLGRYVVQDGEAGVAVYRLAHQSLADHLRPPHRGRQEQPFDQQALAVSTALLGRYRRLLAGGVAAETPGYLWRYVWRHAAAAGPPGLSRLRELAADEPALAPDVAIAALDIADQLGHWGRRQEAVPVTEEAVQLYRGQAATNPAFLPNLAGALSNLGILYSEIGRRQEAVPVTEEAVELRRGQAATNPAFLPNLAGALSNLGNRYSAVGRRQEAVPVTEEAVELYRGQAATNPAFLPDLATALSNLGIRYSEIGRRQEAVPVTEEAVELRRGQAATNPAFLPNLAGALSNLGNRYSEIGRRQEAVPVTEEAVELYRGQAATNPAFLPDLAGALSNLSIRYSAVGRRQEAVPVTEEAVELRRGQAATNPAFLPNLAGALSNLGILYSAVGRRQEAVPVTEEAVELRRGQAATNLAFLPDLAGALSNLSIRYSEIGRRQDAVPVTEEAVELRRGQAATNPAFLPNLAAALSNLGILYSEIGRRQDAVPVTEEAVELYREQAATNPAFLPDLATALTNLGNRYSEIGRRQDAVPVTEEAVELRREQAATNPAFLPDLAGTLSNLGVRYGEIGRREDAVPVTEQAVELYRGQAATNPAFLPDLAGALSNLGILYSEIGRREEAVPVTEEAVELRREQAATNPAFLPNLATALTNLGNRYSEIGRRQEAVPVTEEAVELRREQAATNPAFLPDLAAALSNLGNRCLEAGMPERAAGRWQDITASAAPYSAAFLGLARAGATVAGYEDAPTWLAAALELADDRKLASRLHDEARRHRQPDPIVFDVAWEATTAKPAPPWLTIDDDVLAIARGWIGTDTYSDERDYLAAHCEILDAAVDLAVEEAILHLEDDDASRYRGLREDARAQGVEVAYRPLLLMNLTHDFVRADVDRQRELLALRRDELLSDEVADVVNELAEAEDERTRLLGQRVRALLDLSRLGDADSALDALDDQDRFPDLLRTLAMRPEPGALAPAAYLAASGAHTAAAAAIAAFFLACATAIADDDEQANALLAAALELDATQAGEWITTLAEIGRQHPAVLALIAPLANPSRQPEEPLEGDEPGSAP